MKSIDFPKTPTILTKGERVVAGIPFIGTYDDFKLDSKGRLSIPAKWRDRLGKLFYMVAVTVKGCRCATLYPEAEYLKLVAKTQCGTEGEIYDAEKELYSKTEECTLDAQGRFTLDRRLKELSLLENNTTVILEGNGSTIEIWNQEQYNKIHGTFDPALGVFDLIDRAHARRKESDDE